MILVYAYVTQHTNFYDISSNFSEGIARLKMIEVIDLSDDDDDETIVSHKKSGPSANQVQIRLFYNETFF
jgi:hypothetical protein